MTNITVYLGQFFHHKVRINSRNKQLYLADGRVVSVEEGVVWKTVHESFVGKMCWYPAEGESVIEGQPWDYVVDNIAATHYKYSLYTKTSKKDFYA